MEWLSKGRPHFSGEESSVTEGSNKVQSLQQQSQSPHHCNNAITALYQSQQHCMKASILSGWRLAEAQDQLCSLGVHSSESLEQERARTSACPSELSHTEQEWQLKESMLGGCEPSCSPVQGVCASWDVFDRSIINVQHPTQSVEKEQGSSKPFVQMYEQDVKHFGMLRRWDDSQRFLSDMPQLICEDTANFLILWCITLQQEGKEALMEQVAHQAVVMQFILEMASNSQQDPRGCFRQFFHKAKGGSQYQEVFHSELEAFKLRIHDYAVKCKESSPNNVEQRRSDTKAFVDSLPSTEECSMKHGLWTNTVRWTLEDHADTEDILVMETS